MTIDTTAVTGTSVPKPDWSDRLRSVLRDKALWAQARHILSRSGSIPVARRFLMSRVKSLPGLGPVAGVALLIAFEAVLEQVLLHAKTENGGSNAQVS